MKEQMSEVLELFKVFQNKFEVYEKMRLKEKQIETACS